MNRYGSILDKQRKRIQNSAMIQPVKGSRAHFINEPSNSYGNNRTPNASNEKVNKHNSSIGSIENSRLLPDISLMSTQKPNEKSRKSYSTLRPYSKLTGGSHAQMMRLVGDEEDENVIRELVKSQYFRQSGISEEMIKKKRDVRQNIANLNVKCQLARSQTNSTLKKLRDQLEIEEFNGERHDFVTTTLQEFDNLDPGSLDVIFEYKAEDVMIQKEDIRNDRRWQREVGSQNRMPIMKMVNHNRKV